MQKLPGFLFIPLLVFLLISVYQTAVGFTSVLGPVLAWMFSIGIGIMLFFIAYIIGNMKVSHRPYTIPMLAFLFCSLISFSGNFNAIYTNYMKQELFKTELVEKKTEINKVSSAADKALRNYDPATTNKLNKVTSLKNQLVSQITDPANAGLGERARSIIAEIEGLLGERLTAFSGSPEQIAKKYNDNIDQILKQKFQSGDRAEQNKLIQRNEQLRQETVNNTIGRVLEEPKLIVNEGDKAIMKTVEAINLIGTETKEFIGDDSVFDFTPAKFNNSEIGNIVFSFKSSVQHPVHMLIIGFFSFFIDWVGLIIILMYASVGLGGGTQVQKKKPVKVNNIKVL